ncbi:hypothetical protein U5801_28465, partial [Lamprobacter modestohalophilus]|uniref:hypothetical protein n=1 Tax=Lamprobacter modestohalophilus TaxID=1064514 RepID=UPI002ADEBA73
TTDDMAKAVNLLLSSIKTRNIVESNRILIRKIGGNVDDYIPVIKNHNKAERAELLVVVAQEKNIVDASQALRLNRALLNGNIKESEVIDSIRKGRSLKQLLNQVNTKVTDSAKDRLYISKPPYRINRLKRQEAAKDQIRNNRHKADYKARWETANKTICRGQVHHIIPLQLTYGKNQRLEKIFDNCGEYFFADSPDYIHGHRNTVCILDGHANHPRYTKMIEKSFSSIPLSLSREKTCQKIGE